MSIACTFGYRLKWSVHTGSLISDETGSWLIICSKKAGKKLVYANLNKFVSASLSPRSLRNLNSIVITTSCKCQKMLTVDKTFLCFHTAVSTETITTAIRGITSSFMTWYFPVIENHMTLVLKQSHGTAITLITSS